MGLAKENGLVDSSINSRFAAGNSYMNLMDYSLDSRILNKLLVSQSMTINNDNSTTKPPNSANSQINKAKTDSNSSAKFSKNLFINFRKNDEKIILKKPILEKQTTTTTTMTMTTVTKTKSISGRSNKKARPNSSLKNNMPESKSNKGFNPAFKTTSMSLTLNNNNYSSGTNNFSTTTTTTTTNITKKKENMGEITCRVYTDEPKYIYIKTWLDEVERVHALEGKCLETINKITFYD